MNSSHYECIGETENYFFNLRCICRRLFNNDNFY
nr:MAG TPA: hypothetical protein [Caudoviricetes sp.]